MKTHFKLILFFILAITKLNATAEPLYSYNDYQIEQQNALLMLKRFYENYIREVSGGINEKAINSILRKNCTKELFEAIPKLQSKSDSDLFLNAQDSDISILKSLLIVPDKNIKNDYVVSYIYDNEKMEIHLSTVKLRDGYKISAVKL
ncbi:MAG: hypothetical protein V4687_00930 [Bacteroidota bacterium]